MNIYLVVRRSGDYLLDYFTDIDGALSYVTKIDIEDDIRILEKTISSLEPSIYAVYTDQEYGGGELIKLFVDMEKAKRYVSYLNKVMPDSTCHICRT